MQPSGGKGGGLPATNWNGQMKMPVMAVERERERTLFAKIKRLNNSYMNQKIVVKLLVYLYEIWQ